VKNKRVFVFALIIVVLLSALVGGAALAQSSSAPMWGVEYFTNLDWVGPAATVVWVPSLYFNWNGNPPASNVPATNWFMWAARTSFFYNGTYRFEFLVDDDFQFRIDDRVFLDTINRGQSGKSFAIDLPMTQGNHHIEIRYRQYTGNSYLYYRETLLSPSGATPTPAPGVCLTPQPSASSVQTQFGDYTRCIQNNLHQSECFVSDGAWDSPNLGSIQMEPKIAVWGNCTPDSWGTMVIQQCGQPQQVKCSKTGAGWFPG
jgi:hypothetical protein